MTISIIMVPVYYLFVAYIATIDIIREYHLEVQPGHSIMISGPPIALKSFVGGRSRKASSLQWRHGISAGCLV